MDALNCFRCQRRFDATLESCPDCGEKVTAFQRTYSDRLIDSKYQILERLGVGGMGEIFKVRHIHLNELRVIKVMRANIASDDQALQRFLHEARTSTMIKHRNLAMLYDFSTLDDGSYYMVWEYIEGTNIQKWMGKHGTLPPRLALEISIQALEGIGNLHTMGIIHRDISPENIMLSQDHQRKLLVKVIDFGIAKQLSDSEGGHGLTQTGMFLGKLKYASPEQAGFLQEGERLDARSDLYSFGVVMYEMLAGRAPFLATNPHGYILKHATEKPLAIGVVNPAAHIPPVLEAEVMRALEKDRDKRHQSAAEFVAALTALRDQVPPDDKFGLGDLVGTLSGQITLVDTAERSKATTPATRPAPAPPPLAKTVPGPGRVVSDSDSVFSSAPTFVDGEVHGEEEEEESEVTDRTVPGSPRRPQDEPTLVTPEVAAWRRVQDQEPTALQPAAVPAKPARPAKWIGVAAAVVVIALTGVWYFGMREKPVPDVTPTTTSSTAVGTSVTVTEPPPLSPGEGELVLLAKPWGQIERIVELDGNAAVELPAGDVSTPIRLNLPAGRYRVEIAGPGGVERRSVEVNLEAGQRPIQHVTFSMQDLDSIAGEILRQ